MIEKPKSNLTVSAKVILDALSVSVPKTQGDLRKETGMKYRAVSYSLKRLKAIGLTIEKFNWRDGRQVLYLKKPQDD